MREASSVSSIAFLATGSELIDGSVLNTMTPFMAGELFALGYTLGEHRLVTDERSLIAQSITSLLEHHEVLIISGGLGPTSDDITRFALADALGAELVFFPAVWDDIVHRLQRLGVPVTDNNRVQAMLPPDCQIFPNDRGTAVGCAWERDGRYILLLPGPPKECQPMFRDFALPALKKWCGPARFAYKKHWYLLGVSESDVAARCDKVTLPEGVQLAYRTTYPYLQLKVLAESESMGQAYAAELKTHLEDKSVGESPASDQLKALLASGQYSMCVVDNATHGLFQAALTAPDTLPAFIESGQDRTGVRVELKGMDDYWSRTFSETYSCELRLSVGDNSWVQSAALKNRGEKTRQFFQEWACFQCLLGLADLGLDSTNT